MGGWGGGGGGDYRGDIGEGQRLSGLFVIGISLTTCK